MTNDSGEDDSMHVASERHAQLMRDLQKFGNRLAWGALGVIVVVCATIYFFFKYHPFWRYP